MRDSSAGKQNVVTRDVDIALHVVFNTRMSSHHPDAKVIDQLGGPAKVARLLGLNPKTGATQRIQNWKTRGIPAAVRLRHLDTFGRAANDS